MIRNKSFLSFFHYLLHFILFLHIKLFLVFLKLIYFNLLHIIIRRLILEFFRYSHGYVLWYLEIIDVGDFTLL